MSAPVWLITAASSGFGKAIAVEALSRGHQVLATARNPAKLDDLKAAGAKLYELDVTWDFSRIQAAIDLMHKDAGRIDILINSAGYILEGALEETSYVFLPRSPIHLFQSSSSSSSSSAPPPAPPPHPSILTLCPLSSPEETLAEFTTNVFGMLNVTRAVLPHMRAAHSGVIANFGSLGSWRGGPAVSNYTGPKWAGSGISESLYEELKPLGITCTVIEPGYFRTGFLNAGARVQSAKVIDDYTNTAAGQVRNALTTVDNNQPGDVVKGSRVIVDVLTKTGVAEGKDIPIRLVLGKDCVATIRQKCESTLALLKEWEPVISSTDHDA